MRARPLLLVVALLTLCAPARASAQTSAAHALAARLRVEPEGDRCLSQSALRARVLERLSRQARLSDVDVVVHVDARMQLEVWRAGQRIAVRRFEALPARCGARRDAIAVAIALALEREGESAPEAGSAALAGTDAVPSNAAQPSAAQPNAAQPPSAAQPPTDAQPPSAAQPNAAQPPPAIAEPSASSEPAEASFFAVHAGAAVLFEALPSNALVAVLGVELLADPALRFAFSAIASLPQRDERLGASIESQLVLGRLLGCGQLRAGVLVLEGCAGALGGAVFAEGRGYAADSDESIGYAALVARGALRFPAESSLSLRLALDGLLPLVRPEYAVREGTSMEFAAITVAPVGAMLGLEVVLALP
jgi:hypothetical protein